MTTLQIIIKQTENFKIDFLNSIEKFATNEFNDVFNSYSGLNKLQLLELILENTKEFNEIVVTDYGYSFKYEGCCTRKWNIIYNILEFSNVESYVANVLKIETKSFNNKQINLANRIEKKNLKENFKIEILNDYPNLEGYANDGENKVSFYTIVASGEIQKPHFRYLFK